MKAAEVQVNMWDKSDSYAIGELDLKIGDYVVVENFDGLEIGKIVNIIEVDEKKLDENQKKLKVSRKAELKDLEKLEQFEKNKDKDLAECKKLIEKNKLPMKLVDAHYSFDDKKMTFAFIAESRVDFRQLVKDLTRLFQKSIRLQQLGVRDEAKVNGDIGACGIVQCCKTHLRELGNVSAEHAELQQVSHRGAERLSGICGRLKCCLRYENDLYKELSQGFPEIGKLVKTSRGKGEIVDWHILKKTVGVRLKDADDTFVELPIEEIH